jgi:hypothetical protein
MQFEVSRFIIDGNYLYGPWNDLMQPILKIYDLTTPEEPTLVSTLDLSPSNTVTVSSHLQTAFVGRSGGTASINIANATDPRIQWDFQTGGKIDELVLEIDCRAALDE